MQKPTRIRYKMCRYPDAETVLSTERLVNNAMTAMTTLGTTALVSCFAH
jgi:hypothetical protein